MASVKPKFMLGKLFGSNARVKILKLFISHPDKRYYIRQIARNLKLQLNSVRRELENLAQFGFLLTRPNLPLITAAENPTAETPPAAATDPATETKSKADRKYYQANTEFVLYHEIKDLLIKSQILYEREFVDKLYKIGKPKLLILTGYFVNIPQAIDLLLVGRINKIKLVKIIRELENELGREVNYTLMDMNEFRYRRDITDVFLYEILENKKIIVINDVGVS